MRTRPPSIEPLELRIAPATLTGQVLTYTDLDGDKVAITFSAGTVVGGMFTFNTGSVNGDNATPQQLRLIELTGGVGFAGADITMKVTKAGGGDGLAAVGRINAGANDLGKVVLKGDLGGITVGTGTAGTPALELLSVASMGVYGAATQVGSDFFSTITGSLGALKVAGEMKDSIFRVVGDALGTIGSVTIGGSLVGGAELRSGSITSTSDIGAVKIGRNLIGSTGDESGKIDAGGKLASLTIGGSILGGAGDYDTFTDTNTVLHSGQVFAVGDIGAVKIARDVVAADGLFSAAIHSHGALGGSVTIGGTLFGADDQLGADFQLVGDTGIGAVKIGRSLQGDITSGGALASLTVGGDVSGKVTATGAIGLVKIGRDLGTISKLDAGTTLAGLTLGGSVRTQTTIESGGQMGLVKIAGNVDGRLTLDSGGGLAGVVVGGSIRQDFSSTIPTSIKSVGDIGTFKVKGDATLMLLESTAGGVGTLSVGGDFLFVEVTLAGKLGGGKFGSLFGSEIDAMSIGTLQIARDATSSRITAQGGVGSLSVGGNSSSTYTLGDTAKMAIKGSVFGSILFSGTNGSLTIGGDLRGSVTTIGADIGALTIGGSFLVPTLSGSGGFIRVDGRLGALKFGGDIVGPSLPPGGTFGFGPIGLIEAGRFGSVAIGGSVFAGIDESNVGVLADLSMIYSHHEIGSLTIKGDLRGTVGSGGDVTPALILAANEVVGLTTDLAIGKVTIGGTVERAGIHAGAGVFPFMTGTNGNASIGAVKVGGDWIASTLTAGARDVNGNGFGNADDDVVNDPAGAEADAIIAKIASITIGRTLAGTSAGTDQFGFVAQEIGALKIGARTVTLTPGSSNDSINLIFTNDTQLSER